jgi:NAD-dependent dihydropyrimidine dehydrogenase PreA subunit
MKYLKNVVTLQHNPDKCTGCGMCLAVCPHRVFEKSGGKVRIADRDKCMECGACQRNCPFAAIQVEEGVGCAAAILIGLLTGTEPTCG